MRVFGFAGWSGSGKTTLIETLVPRLTGRGLRVSLVKHAHHDFDVDRPGKDSYRHRMAGCDEVLVTSGVRWALMHELRGAPELTLADALARLSACDLALVEGWKRAAIPKLEVWRERLGKPQLHPATLRSSASRRTRRNGLARRCRPSPCRMPTRSPHSWSKMPSAGLSPIDEFRRPAYVEPDCKRVAQSHDSRLPPPRRRVKSRK